MNYPAGNPYQPYYPYPAPTAPALRASAAPRYEIIHVTGRRGAEALQMAPNSSVLALDDTAPLVWLCRTDGAGYLTVTPFDIAQHAEPPRGERGRPQRETDQIGGDVKCPPTRC